MSSLLETIAFRQPRRAQDEMGVLESGLPVAFQSTIEALLASSADPDASVHYLAGLKQQKPDAFDMLARSQSGHGNVLLPVVGIHRRFSFHRRGQVLHVASWARQVRLLEYADPLVERAEVAVEHIRSHDE